MASRTKLTDTETLEQYRVALDNAKKQADIASIMTALGFGPEIIDEGVSLLAITRQAYDGNQTEDDETNAAYAGFANKKASLNDIFNMHRKKAKVVFRNDPLVSDKLAISHGKERTYIRWVESAKKFYSVAIADADIQAKLIRLKVSLEDLTAANTLITEMEAARSLYLQEKGESQEATRIKDEAFYSIDDWMSEFYAVAKIGLEDKPQLLEALGKMVRN
mgnify:CR=1 FL=1|tara:strand:- start:9477 stop:10136 length:660 start_codon:yes stop_codon:yes gene_type:complete